MFFFKAWSYPSYGVGRYYPYIGNRWTINHSPRDWPLNSFGYGGGWNSVGNSWSFGSNIRSQVWPQVYRNIGQRVYGFRPPTTLNQYYPHGSIWNREYNQLPTYMNMYRRPNILWRGSTSGSVNNNIRLRTFRGHGDDDSDDNDWQRAHSSIQRISNINNGAGQFSNGWTWRIRPQQYLGYNVKRRPSSRWRQTRGGYWDTGINRGLVFAGNGKYGQQRWNKQIKKSNYT